MEARACVWTMHINLQLTLGYVTQQALLSGKVTVWPDLKLKPQ